MLLFDIVDGPHKGQRIVPMRWDSQASPDAARETLAAEREQVNKECEASDLKLEEVLRLEEIV